MNTGSMTSVNSVCRRPEIREQYHRWLLICHPAEILVLCHKHCRQRSKENKPHTDRPDTEIQLAINHIIWEFPWYDQSSSRKQQSVCLCVNEWRGFVRYTNSNSWCVFSPPSQYMSTWTCHNEPQTENKPIKVWSNRPEMMTYITTVD